VVLSSSKEQPTGIAPSQRVHKHIHQKVRGKGFVLKNTTKEIPGKLQSKYQNPVEASITLKTATQLKHQLKKLDMLQCLN